MRHTAVSLAAALALAAGGASAGTELVEFPTAYKSGHVKYATVDKSDPQRGHSVRDIYADPQTIAALKEGKPVPSGAVLTMEVHRAKVNADKTPVKDADGRFVRDELFAIFVMEKRTGWGTEYPESLRNGEWEYARFNADGKRHENTNMNSCFSCHKRMAGRDFVFTGKELQAKAAE